MIDTIKFFIPILNIEDLNLLQINFTQFKKENLFEKTIEWEFYTKDIFIGSFSRKISVKINEEPQGLFLEFSIPKFYKGNNVEMIHVENLYWIIEDFYNELKKEIDYDFPHFTKWEIYKLDICYNWIFKNKERATSAMYFIQKIDYPRKQKYLYDTSVMYTGSAYTVKFYLKGAEFKVHDFKEIETNRAIKLKEWADKILRFEVSLKKKYLQQLFGYKKLYIYHIMNYEDIIYYLNHFLIDKVFKYINLKQTTDLDVEQILYSSFTEKKATRLYLFYKNYYFDTPIRTKIVTGGMSRMGIYRYKRDLKSVGVGYDIPETIEKNVLEELIIPSTNSKFNLI